MDSYCDSCCVSCCSEAALKRHLETKSHLAETRRRVSESQANNQQQVGSPPGSTRQLIQESDDVSYYRPMGGGGEKSVHFKLWPRKGGPLFLGDKVVRPLFQNRSHRINPKSNVNMVKKCNVFVPSPVRTFEAK